MQIYAVMLSSQSGPGPLMVRGQGAGRLQLLLGSRGLAACLRLESRTGQLRRSGTPRQERPSCCPPPRLTAPRRAPPRAACLRRQEWGRILAGPAVARPAEACVALEDAAMASLDLGAPGAAAAPAGGEAKAAAAAAAAAAAEKCVAACLEGIQNFTAGVVAVSARLVAPRRPAAPLPGRRGARRPGPAGGLAVRGEQRLERPVPFWGSPSWGRPCHRQA